MTASLSIFSCKHKVTKRTICAIPCNGIEELCDDNLDEQCQGPGLIMTLVATFVLSVLFILISSVLSYYRVKKQDKVLANECLKLKNIFKDGTNVSNEHMTSSCLYVKISLHRSTMDIESAIDMVTKYSEHMNQNESSVKDNLFMKEFGTNEFTAYLHDCMNSSVTVRVHLWLYNRIYKRISIKKRLNIGAILILIRSTVSVCLRYTDLSKDTMFLYMIWLQLRKYEYDSFPKIIFNILASSIIVTEIGNIFSILMFDFNGSWWRRVSVVLFAPLMPAYYLYEVLHCEISKFIMLKKYVVTLNEGSERLERISTKIRQIDHSIRALHFKLAKLQYQENVLENFPQVIILILIFMVNKSASPNVAYLQNIFMDERSYLGLILAIISIVSLIRGQINFLEANKNGCLTGTYILLAYFSIGLASRYSSYCVCTQHLHTCFALAGCLL